MKKRIFALAVIVICLAVITGSTLAYFTTESTARNVITSGGIGVEVVEQQLVDGELQPWPDQPIRVMPGTCVSKIVSAGSTAQPAWIRMNYTLTFLDAEGKTMDLTAEELAQVVTIAPNADGWTWAEGWWYYEDALAAGETSEPLFEEVAFSGPNMDNTYSNSTLLIDVNIQGV